MLHDCLGNKCLFSIITISMKALNEFKTVYGRNILLRCIGLIFIINLQIVKFRVKVREKNVNKFLWYFLFNISEIFTKIFTTSNIFYCVFFHSTIILLIWIGQQTICNALHCVTFI